MSAQRASQLVEAGLWLRLSGDNEGAKRLFEQALKLDPANVRARQLLDAPPPPPAAPGTVTRTTMDLDWAAATGRTPTPPPVAPVGGAPKSTTRPFGAGAPPGTHTIKLGEAPAPEIPEAPRFEDPHGEIQISGGDEQPDSSTVVFGLSGIPVPPAAPLGGATAGGTMVFGGAKGAPPRPADSPVGPGSGTTVFGGAKGAPQQPPEPAAGSGSGTMVFSGTKGAPPPTVPPVSGASGTMVFGSTREPRQPGSGTMAFAGKGAPPAVPPVTGARPPNSTMVFGSGTGVVPPPVAPLKPQSTMMFAAQSPGEQGVATEPGMPAFSPEPAYEPHADPGRPGSGTLDFNFDDMVGGLPPPGPIPSPPVPYDRDDAPQTAWDKSNPRIDIAQIDQKGEGGGFDLISAEPPPPPKQRSPAQVREEVTTLLEGAKDLLDLDDHSGAMELISKALELDPGDAAALKLRDRSERTLQAMYESKLGDLNSIPRVKLKDDEIIWLNLDHRAGFVLAQIDGSVTYEDLFAVSGMSRLDTARILAQMVEEGVISKG